MPPLPDGRRDTLDRRDTARRVLAVTYEPAHRRVLLRTPHDHRPALSLLIQRLGIAAYWSRAYGGYHVTTLQAADVQAAAEHDGWIVTVRERAA